MAEHLGAGVVVVRGAGTIEAALMLARMVRDLRVAGTRLGPAGAAVAVTMGAGAAALLDQGGASPTGRRGVPDPGGQSGSPVVAGASLSTAEAARLLGVSPRQVRRLDVGSWRVGGRLVHDRAAVAAEAARRHTARTTRPAA